MTDETEHLKTIDQYLRDAARLEEDGHYRKAVAELKKALRVAKDKNVIYRALGRVYARQNRRDEAVAVLQEAVGLDPSDVEARELLMETLLEAGDFDGAISQCKEILRISRRNLSAREVLSIAYLQKGMLDNALQVTNDLITLDPNSPSNHFRKAWLFQQKGDYGNAINEFTRVLEMDPSGEMAEDAQQAIDSLDSYQLRHIIMLALEDYIFRSKLIRDPEGASLERGYYLSYAGMSALKQVRFEELPDVYSEWKQRYYH